MPNGCWINADAAELNSSQPYDFVISSAVFLYFPSLAYTRSVLAGMIRKARRGVMVLDVSDLAKREQALKLRRQWIGDEDYARKYAGLDHLYFGKTWFSETLADLGVSNFRIEDQQIDGYANSCYRYNVFAWL